MVDKVAFYSADAVKDFTRGWGEGIMSWGWREVPRQQAPR